MISHDISSELFDITDHILETTIPVYQYQLEELNIKIPYIHIDKIVKESMKISTIDKAIWYAGLDDVAATLLNDRHIDNIEYEDILMYCRLGIKPD